MWKIEKIIKKGDYNYALVPGHPNSTKNGYVLEHRVVIENSIGRLLNQDEIVHHKNGDKKDNRISNLEISSNSKHASMHAKAKGITMARIKCVWCGLIFDRPKHKTHIAKGGTFTACSSHCRGKFSSEMFWNGLTTRMKMAISVNILKIFKSFKTMPRKPR